jgi:hypothetical protein
MLLQGKKKDPFIGSLSATFSWHPDRPHDFQRVLSTIDSRVEHRLLARLLVADMEGDCCLSLLILSFFVTSPKPGLMEKRN